MSAPLVPGAPPRPDWERLRDERFDVLVVGGGVHGLGLSRALAGSTRVAVVERGDWAAGTSSRSSKLFHGGLRYLREGRLSLVRESLAERDHHLRAAPDLVRRVRFRVRGGRGAPPGWQLRAGIALYDLLSGFSSGARPWAAEPEYDDAVTDDAAFCRALLADARARGAVAVNHVRVTGWTADGAEVRDAVSGATATVRAARRVNATGPWAATLAPGERLRLTRGTHVVLRGAGEGPARLFFSPEDGRALLLVPYGEGRWLLGTTDLDEPAPAAEPVPRPEEIAYLGRSFRAVYPEFSGWRPTGWQCGLRPLLDAPGDPSSVSRESAVHVDPATGVITLLGGKYTGYRLVARQAAAALGRSADDAGRLLPADPAPPEESFAAGDAVTVEDVLFRRCFAGPAGEVGPPLLARVVEAWRGRWGRTGAAARAESARLEHLLAARAAVLEAWPRTDFPPGE